MPDLHYHSSALTLHCYCIAPLCLAVVLFGYISLFAAAFPLAPLVGVIACFLEVVLDRSKVRGVNDCATTPLPSLPLFLVLHYSCFMPISVPFLPGLKTLGLGSRNFNLFPFWLSSRTVLWCCSLIEPHSLESLTAIPDSLPSLSLR